MSVVVLIPAYNAGKTITKVIERIPKGLADEIIVVNDGSRDNTQEVLERIPSIRIISHPQNRGYGAAQISLYEAALESGADFIAIMHADEGHFPEELPVMLAPLRDGSADLVAGSRTIGLLREAKPFLGSKTLGAMFRGAMPPHKFAANLALTWLANLAFHTNYHSFHCGFRSYTRDALMRIPFAGLTQGYLFDTASLMESHVLGLRIAEVPISTHYDEAAGSSVPSIRYGFQILLYIFRRRLRMAKDIGRLSVAEGAAHRDGPRGS